MSQTKMRRARQMVLTVARNFRSMSLRRGHHAARMSGMVANRPAFIAAYSAGDASAAELLLGVHIQAARRRFIPGLPQRHGPEETESPCAGNAV
jgi:DNA-binding GntR family transcriptional regulator